MRGFVIAFMLFATPISAQTYFALVPSLTVQNVIVADPTFIASRAEGDPKTWQEAWSDGSGITKNFPSIGWSYNQALGAFVEPQPFPSWTLDSVSAHYQPPIPMPANPPAPGKLWKWNEPTQNWVPQ